MNLSVAESKKTFAGSTDILLIFPACLKTAVNMGYISDPHAREYGTAVYLCEEPSVSFNAFWSERIKQVR
ncbi:MAG: hypothetical protein K0B05_02125 [Bacteroidales bacterium]|nr:hypothetical protein [Bacteroidales bacterium]